MEKYRSKTSRYDENINNFYFGDYNEKQYRKQIETSTGDFYAMDDRKDIYIKVAERLSTLFGRQIFIRWEFGQMKVFFGKKGEEDEYSVVCEASGLVNVISILAALFDESIDVLLIDEPEASLHPQLQSYLLNEMKNVISKFGTTIILSTHSAEMIDFTNANELSNFVFFNGCGLPKQIAPTADELKSNVLKEFLLRMGINYKEGFFAKTIMLIEGASDLIVCKYLANRLNLNLEVAGTQIIPVDGKGQFPVVTKLFRLIGKNVCILTDLDGYSDDNCITNLFVTLEESIDLANKCGISDLQEILRNANNKTNDLISTNVSLLKPIYEKHPYWINKESDADETKIIRRSVLACLFSDVDDKLSIWPNSQQRVSLRKQLVSLFDYLGKLGCFILRLGTIESYYCFADNFVFNAKPSQAVKEINGIEEMDQEEVEQKYSDIIKALKFASLNKKVNEGNAIKKELYSELALVIGLLKNEPNSSEKDFLSAIKQVKGSPATIFEYTIINNGIRKGVSVNIKSNIIDVSGFPFTAYIDDNVNNLIDETIK